MNKPQNLRAKVTNIEWISDQVIKIDLEILDTDDFVFEAGQHVNVKIDDKAVRPYSIYSDFSNPKTISIVVSAAHEGAGSNYLRNLKLGETVEIFGPAGKLALPQELKPNLTFLATGTGVVPFMTMLNKLEIDKCDKNIILYFGVTDRAGIFFKEKLEELKTSLKNFDYKICLSDPKKTWEECVGYINQAFEIDKSGDTQYFICGVRPMVKGVNDLLKSEGVSEKNIIK